MRACLPSSDLDFIPMKRLAAAILILVAAALGLTFGAVVWHSFRDEPGVIRDSTTSSSETINWFAPGVPVAALLGGVALYVVRSAFVKPS